MEYRRFGNFIVARLDVGEEILGSLYQIAAQEHIALAEVSALGEVSEAVLTAFSATGQKNKLFRGNLELISLTGLMHVTDGGDTSLQACVGNEKLEAFFGRLERATVSTSCESVLRVIA